jgi:hypothetical protein
MKSGLRPATISKIVGGTFALVTVSSIALASTPPRGVAVLPPAVVVAPTTLGHKAPHPEIMGAIRALERAKQHLQDAAHDFNGHRADALAACDAAIRQLNIIIAYDK